MTWRHPGCGWLHTQVAVDIVAAACAVRRIWSPRFAACAAGAGPSFN